MPQERELLAVEYNYLSEIAHAQSEGKTLEQKASEHVKAENERYNKANCGGTQKMFDELGIKNIEVKVVKE